jgi:MipA family protein
MRAPRLPQTALLVSALLTAALSAAPAAPAGADEKPLWELGLGAGVLVFNDYRGAATTHAYPLPVPYIVYRGDLLKADHNGVRGRLFDDKRIDLNLSVNGTTPVRNDSARAGMPDLRPTLEIGPELDVHLWRSAAEHLKFDLRLPARAAFTIEAEPHLIGLFLAPHLSLDIAQFRGSDGWKLGLLAGPLFADRRYDAYFYTVAPQYATAARPAFEAAGGYAGMQALASLTRRYPRYWIGAYVRHDSLAGASFADSPLVKRDSYWSAGFGVAWLIRQSSQLVESDD